MKNSKVSIIIPVYKGANFLAEAIDSALAQTYDNIEVIVINDGSPDDGATERVALSYGDKIKYFYKENGGVSTALNLGIEKMSGDYFSWLSHDDLYHKDKIKIQMEKVLNETDIPLCTYRLIDEDGDVIKNFNLEHNVRTEGRKNNVEILSEIAENKKIVFLGMLVPKSVFDDVGLFKVGMKYMQDTEMIYRILQHKKYNWVCHNDILFSNRVHKGQITNQIPHEFYKDKKEVLAYQAQSVFDKDLGIDFQKALICLCAMENEVEPMRKLIYDLKGKKQFTMVDRFKVIKCRSLSHSAIIYRKVRDFRYKLKKMRS